MRLEATILESRGAAVVKLAGELGLSRSQVVGEAVALLSSRSGVDAGE